MILVLAVDQKHQIEAQKLFSFDNTMSTPTITAIREETARVAGILAEHTTGDISLDESRRLQAVEYRDEARRPGSNPTWWPTDHRRMPDYRPARYHPEWHELTNNSAVMETVVLVLFGGCSIISVRVLRQSEKGSANSLPQDGRLASETTRLRTHMADTPNSRRMVDRTILDLFILVLLESFFG